MKEKLLIFKDNKINLQNTINLLLLIMIFSAIFGFIYETIFYKIDLGYFVKRGSSFGPWIPIYGFGGLLITVFTYRLKKKPYFVFIINCIVTGILEYLTGYVLFHLFNTRLWDYNTEIWNFGNINGYVCLRSVMFFGISSLFLIYIMIPTLIKLTHLIKEKSFTLISYSLTLLYIIDLIIYNILR